jgi:hypothetical protein
MVAVQQGPVFQGKAAPSEIIVALLGELERLDHNAVLYGAPRADEIRRAIPRDPSSLESKEAEGVVEELICALSDCAGTDELYFGRKHPSSNEFGFWKCPE